MLSSMRRPNSLSGWLRALALPLALWSAIPGVQWCQVGWAEVSLECFAECSIERPDRSVGEACAPAVCDGSARGCPAGMPACGLAPCGSATEPSEAPPAGRAYCLSGPAGGDAIPPVPLDASPPLAILPAAGWAAMPATVAWHPLAQATARPPRPAGGAVPRIRAPPRSGSTTC